MGYNLLSCERDQSYLMPPSMRDWLSEGHLAWFIVDAVGQMDLRVFYAVYRSDGWGAAAYDPGMMVAILLYGYCLGVRSSRRIARALEEDVGFRVVAANRQPDFRTICPAEWPLHRRCPISLGIYIQYLTNWLRPAIIEVH